jgi:hypothetical protein
MTNEFLKNATLFLVEVTGSMLISFFDAFRKRELLLFIVLAIEKD